MSPVSRSDALADSAEWPAVADADLAAGALPGSPPTLVAGTLNARIALRRHRKRVRRQLALGCAVLLVAVVAAVAVLEMRRGDSGGAPVSFRTAPSSSRSGSSP